MTLSLLLLFIFITPFIPIATLLEYNEQCRFGGEWNSLWQQCDCVPVGSEPSLHIICRQMPSSTIPPLPGGEQSRSPPPNIVALTMTEGGLAFIQQDAFKHHNIQTLDFSHNHIQTVNVNAFRGLEMKLTQLHLKHNNLSVIPAWALTYLHQLQFLHLENNRITHVRPNTFDETQLKHMQFLHLDFNQIQLIPNLSFHRLRLIVLTLSNNRITEIEKMSLPQTLSFLDLRNNQLKQIPFLALKDLIGLQSLNLEGNNITTLDYNPEVNFKTEIKLVLRNNKIRRLSDDSFKSFRKFKELDLSYNQISKVYQTTFETVSYMKSLDLSYNAIAYIPIGTFKNFAKNLERLNLEENVIHTLPDALRDLHNLTYLNLNGNKLNMLEDDIVNGFKKSLTELFLAYNHLKDIPTTALNKMEKLQHLDLSKNRINRLERFAFGTSDGRDTNLIILNLAGNQITNLTDPAIFLYMSSLAYLDLSYNHIHHIGEKAFEKLPGLEKLFLQNNQMKKFPSLKRMHKLRHLVVDNNKIESLPNYVLGDLMRLEHLSLAGNKLSVIDEKIFHSSSSKQLKSLNLASNRISIISNRAFSMMENLQHLKLSNNKIRSIPPMAFADLRSLRYLDLSHNELSQVFSSAFSHLPVLETLLLHHNKIQKLDKDAFIETNKIDGLDLSHNLFKTFRCEFLNSIHTIIQLDLSHNHITNVELTCIKRNLQRLDLSYNDLQTIGKEMMHSFDTLNHLSLSHNGILEVQQHAFQSCPKLNSLDLSHNHIRSIWKGTFSNQELLSTLDLSRNALNSVQRGSFGKNNILILNLSNNELSHIPIEAIETTCDSLSALNIAYNKIKTIDASQLVGLRNITRLVLSQNRIESVEEAAFEHLTNLKMLDISHNPITSWSPAAFRDLSHSIVHLNLADTGLFSVPKISHRSIRSLNISSNKIYELSKRDFLPMTKLMNLDLSFNNLKTLGTGTFDDLVDLKHLNMSGNSITELHEDHLKSLYQLESLHIWDMPFLQNLPSPYSFSQLTNLKEFQIFGIPDNIQQYNVSEILRHLPPLRVLHVEIKENILDKQLHETDMRLLRQLIITGYNLTTIDIGAFINVRGYKFSLTIRDSSIQEFPSAIFNTLTSINYLELSLPNNHLQYIDPFKNTAQPAINQHGTILQSIDISGNPIRCDCSMHWVSEWVRSDISTSSFRNTFCGGSQNLGPPLTDFYHLNSVGTQCRTTNGLTNSLLVSHILLLIIIVFILFY